MKYAPPPEWEYIETLDWNGRFFHVWCRPDTFVVHEKLNRYAVFETKTRDVQIPSPKWFKTTGTWGSIDSLGKSIPAITPFLRENYV